ncbi:hypothetical protein RUND412_010293 [Rhizina undulata]
MTGVRLPAAAGSLAIESLRDLSTFAVNAERLNSTLHETCRWGADHLYGSDPTEIGMARLSLTDSDKHVRNWFVNKTVTLGCHVQVDQMGNIFAIRPGKFQGPPTAMGSHLDTQPTGGRYDGILGVMAGIEALRRFMKTDTRQSFRLLL